MMKIENFKAEKNKLKFDLRDASVSLANAIRRTIMSEVPSIAIDEVDFYENTTSLFDEYIAHRLGMIPLVTDLKSYKVASECCGGNCSKCSTIFTLEFTGPGTAYSKELKGKDKNIVPVFDNIPIMKLEEGQSLRLEAKAVLVTTVQQQRRWLVVSGMVGSLLSVAGLVTALLWRRRNGHDHNQVHAKKPVGIT